MMILLLGPLSSASPKGQGPFFSWLFVIVGAWVLIKTWMDYKKRQPDSPIPLSKFLGVGAIALVFVVVGVWGLVDH
jgi:TRAP-type uncharacterized transport system fused permease subunit